MLPGESHQGNDPAGNEMPVITQYKSPRVIFSEQNPKRRYSQNKLLRCERGIYITSAKPFNRNIFRQIGNDLK